MVAAAASACHEAAAPVASEPAVEHVLAGVSYSATAGATFSFVVPVDPTRDNVYTDGTTTVRIPAGAICDPATSSYGPGTWDSPCTPAASLLRIPVTVRVLSPGRAVLHFGLDMRFVPTNDPARQVTMTVNAPAVKTTSENLRRFAIFWLPSGSDKVVDEAATDGSVVTVIDRTSGKLTRRLKHFSGYVIRDGGVAGTCLDPEASIHDDCVPAGEVVTSNQ